VINYWSQVGRFPRVFSGDTRAVADTIAPGVRCGLVTIGVTFAWQHREV
jgi:hypothetical protein